jgi:hypothetical protein
LPPSQLGIARNPHNPHNPHNPFQNVWLAATISSFFFYREKKNQKTRWGFRDSET